MKRHGIITIDNVEHKTEIKDLEDMGELGNGTSGHVVKMKHKLTNKVIAVKVRFYLITTKFIEIVNRQRLSLFQNQYTSLYLLHKVYIFWSHFPRNR